MKIITYITASIVILCAASCTLEQRQKFPIKLTISSKKYGVGATYSAKGGVTLGINADDAAAPFIDPQK